MSNLFSGCIGPHWETDVETLKEFMSGLIGQDGWSYKYSFGGTGKNVPWLTVDPNLRRNMFAVCLIRLPKTPTAAIEMLENEIGKSAWHLPLSTLALFYICASVHYKLCCMQLETGCFKKLQHQASIDYVCAKAVDNRIYNTVLQLKQQRLANKELLAIADVRRNERKKIRAYEDRINSRYDILDL